MVGNETRLAFETGLQRAPDARSIGPSIICHPTSPFPVPPHASGPTTRPALHCVHIHPLPGQWDGHIFEIGGKKNSISRQGSGQTTCCPNDVDFPSSQEPIENGVREKSDGAPEFPGFSASRYMCTGLFCFAKDLIVTGKEMPWCVGTEPLLQWQSSSPITPCPRSQSVDSLVSWESGPCAISRDLVNDI